MQTILRIFSYLGKYPKLATAQLVCAILMTLMLLVFPMMTGRIKREVIDGGEIEKLWPYVAVVVVAFLTLFSLDNFQKQTANKKPFDAISLVI